MVLFCESCGDRDNVHAYGGNVVVCSACKTEYDLSDFDSVAHAAKAAALKKTTLAPKPTKKA